MRMPQVSERIKEAPAQALRVNRLQRSPTAKVLLVPSRMSAMWITLLRNSVGIVTD